MEDQLDTAKHVSEVVNRDPPDHPPKPETIVDNPGKWAKRGCIKCNGRGVIGWVLVAGVRRIPVYCRCARLAWTAQQEAVRSQPRPEQAMASLASLELARDRAMDRSDTLIERAQEDLNRLGALRIKMADLQDQSTDYCGLSELAHEREAAVNDRVELEREVTAKNLAIASHQREIFCHREEISRKKQAIVVAEACIAAWVEHRERLIRDEGSAIDKQLATIDQRIEQAEQARAREERRVRRKMNEAQDRADKLLDRAAKIRREAGIEIDHHDADQEDVAGDDGPGRGQMVEVCRPGGGDERM